MTSPQLAPVTDKIAANSDGIDDNRVTKKRRSVSQSVKSHDMDIAWELQRNALSAHSQETQSRDTVSEIGGWYPTNQPRSGTAATAADNWSDSGK